MALKLETQAGMIFCSGRPIIDDKSPAFPTLFSFTSGPCILVYRKNQQKKVTEQLLKKMESDGFSLLLVEVIIKGNNIDCFPLFKIK